MPILSALLSTLLLLGLAIILPLDTQFGTIFATIVAVTAALSGWLYVATRRVAAGRVHGIVMAVIGCFGLLLSLGIRGDPSISGGHGPDANPTAGVFRAIDLGGAAIGAVAILCGALVIWNTFNASRRNSTVA